MTPTTYSQAPERTTRFAAMLFVPAGLDSRCGRRGSQEPKPHSDLSNQILAA